MSATLALPRRGVDRRGIAVLAVGHGYVDMTQGAVAALLPFLIHRRGYSYAAASTLILALTVTSSLIQPIFGHLADRRSMPWLLPGGVLVAAVGIAVAGVVHSQAATVTAVAVAGLGVGAYHPEAARYANYVSGDRRVSGMSLFSVGGNTGFALGPVFVTPLVLLFGLSGTALLALPAIVVVFWLLRDLDRLQSFRPEHRAATTKHPPAGPDRWGPFALVAGVASWRSGVYFGLQAFVPAYLILHLGSSEASANAGLTVLLISGALGTLVGGPTADRIGRRPVIIGCMAVVGPLVLLLLVAGPILTYPVLALIGFFTVGNFSSTVVLGQEYLPGRVGIASGVTVGAAIGLGGLMAAALGLIADDIGLRWVIAIIAMLAVPALLTALALPRERRA